MAGEFGTEALRLALAGAIVAAVAVPFGVITAAVVRRRRLSLLPRAKPWRIPWGGLELVAVFLVVDGVQRLLILAGVEAMIASVISVPIQLALLLIAARALFPAWKPFRRDIAVFRSDELSLERPIPIGSAFARAMTLAILAWLVLTPVVHLINGLLITTFKLLDLRPDDHPLTRLATGTGWEQVLLLLQACVAAPVIEEVLFRGVLLPWLIGARERNTGGVELKPVMPTVARPIVVMMGTVLFTWMVATRSDGTREYGPLIFAGALAFGFALVWFTVRRARRHYRGIYVSAALFAVVHSGVWPSPVPLFFLGLGLGWLAVKTRGVFVPVVVHGLFNAVSAVFLLRGAA